MKNILARLLSLVVVLCLFPAITLSGCGVRGPLYLPKPPAPPQKPTQEEPKGILWPSNSTPAPMPATTPTTTK